MSAIFKRELKSYFLTPIGYIFFAINALFLCVNFVYIYSYGVGAIETVFPAMHLIEALILPLITMRLFTHEKKQKTDRLLFSAGVRTRDIVFGKFAAAFCLYAITLSPSLVFEAIILSYVRLSIIPYLYSLLGALLLGGALISIGMFVSTLTDSAALAGVITLVINVAVYFASSFAILVNNDRLTAFLTKIAFIDRAANFSVQTFSVADIVYFLLICAAFIFLSKQSLDLKYRFIHLRRAAFIALSALVVCSFAACNFAVTVAAKKIPLEYDMTGAKTNSISKENEEYIKNIGEDVNVTVFAKQNEYSVFMLENCEELYSVYGNKSSFELTVRLLRQYENASNKINLRFVDTNSVEFNNIANSYPGERFAYGDILVCSAKKDNTRYKRLSFYDIYTLSDPTGYAVLGYRLYEIEGNRLETALTRSIDYVLSQKQPKAVIYGGHSDTDYSPKIKSLFEENNYLVSVDNRPLFSSVQDGCDVLIIVSPSRDFTEGELEAVNKFLSEKDKCLLYFACSECKTPSALAKFLSQNGINTGVGILTETDTSLMPNANMPSAIVSFMDEGANPYNKNALFITGANLPLNVCKASAKGVTANSIARTNDTVAAASDNADYPKTDIKSYDTIIESAITVGESKSYIYAFSSAEFFDSEWAENTSTANKEIIISLCTGATFGEKADLVFTDKANKAKSFADKITDGDVVRMRLIVYLIPALILIAGVIVTVKRRRY